MDTPFSDYEGRPEARPFSRGELQAFFDYADDQVERAAGSGHKGALTAYRDATLLKVMYAWGLRRTECSKLDVVDWGRNHAAPEFGRFAMLAVRYGKAKRGGPPRRRSVASVMGWAVDAVADYVENVRPRFGCDDHPALWVTERGGRVKPAEINARFVAYRDALGLPTALVPHSLRHSYVTHLKMSDVAGDASFDMVCDRCPVRALGFAVGGLTAEVVVEMLVGRGIHHLGWGECNSVVSGVVASAASGLG